MEEHKQRQWKPTAKGQIIDGPIHPLITIFTVIVVAGLMVYCITTAVGTIQWSSGTVKGCMSVHGHDWHLQMDIDNFDNSLPINPYTGFVVLTYIEKEGYRPAPSIGEHIRFRFYRNKMEILDFWYDNEEIVLW